MCFYHGDYDWVAEIHEVKTRKSTGEKCGECFCMIPVGQEYTHHYWQEREECQLCEDEEPHDECDFGEESECIQCQECLRLIAAIAVVEEAEGCKGSETKPSIGGLYEEVTCGEGWAHYANEYAKLRPDDKITWPE